MDSDDKLMQWLQPMADAILGDTCQKAMVGHAMIEDAIEITLIVDQVRGATLAHRVILYRREEIEDHLPKDDAPIRLWALYVAMLRPSRSAAEMQAFMQTRVDRFHAAKRQMMEAVKGQPTTYQDLVAAAAARLAEIGRPSQEQVEQAINGVRDRMERDLSDQLFHSNQLFTLPLPALDRGEVGGHLTRIQAQLHAITGDEDFLIGQLDPDTILSRLLLIEGKLREIADRKAEPPASEPLARPKGPAGSRWS